MSEKLNSCEKCANELTAAQIWAFAGVVGALCFGLASMIFAGNACAAEVVRGQGDSSLVTTVENGVEVTRGMSDYISAPIMEPEKPEPNASRQFFDELDAWKRREVRRKLYPNP